MSANPKGGNMKVQRSLSNSGTYVAYQRFGTSAATAVLSSTAAPLTMPGYLAVVEVAPLLEIIMPAEEQEKEAAVRADGELADEMAAWDAASDRDFLDFEEGLLEGDA